MELIFTQNNFNELKAVPTLIKQRKLKRIEIKLDDQRPPRYSEIVPLLYDILDLEKDCEVWLIDFPYCVLPSSALDHIWTKKERGQGRREACRACKYQAFCSGPARQYLDKYGGDEFKTIKDKPVEVMIEAENRCNLNCRFCFNQISFANAGREKIENKLSGNVIKKIIDQAARLDIPIVRFTGGEPLIRTDLFDLMKYALGQGRRAWLNTNASLITSALAGKISRLAENILIPIESDKEIDEEKITGCKNALAKKLMAIKLLKKFKTPIVRVGTVISRKNIRNFPLLANFILSLPIDEWELYRPIEKHGQGVNISIAEYGKLVVNILELKKKEPRKITIANAIPFCAIKNQYDLFLIGQGALFEDGHNRLVVDPRGFVKPHYFIDKNIGSPAELSSAWQNNFLRKIRKLNYLPSQCEQCRFLFKCRGGSRYLAKAHYNSYFANDPLLKVL